MVSYSAGVAFLLAIASRIASAGGAPPEEKRTYLRENRLEHGRRIHEESESESESASSYRNLLDEESVYPTYSPSKEEDHPKNAGPRPTPWPTYSPTGFPTLGPIAPTGVPTVGPSEGPSTLDPSGSPTTPSPTDRPTRHPTARPTDRPTPPPTAHPTDRPTPSPTRPVDGIREWDSGTAGGARHTEFILPVSMYENNPENRPTVLVLETGNPKEQWYVGYNDVTVTVAKLEDGARYSLAAALHVGESLEIPNWRGTGMDMVITAHSLNRQSSVPYAAVGLAFGPDSEAPTDGPTPSPSDRPTERPTPSPTKLPTKLPTANPTKLPTKLPTMNPTKLPTKLPTLHPTTLSPTDGPTTSPSTGPTLSCGNSICEAHEAQDTCPADCVERTFYTPEESYYKKASGQIFAVEARTDGVRIQSFEVIGEKDSSGACSVYTRAGDWEGHENIQEDWELILHSDSVALAKGVPTSLGAFDREVAVPLGAKQSFHVWCKKELKYVVNWDEAAEGVVFGSDGAVAIYEGLSTKYLFYPKGRAKFACGIRYIATVNATAPEVNAIAPEPI